MGNDAPAATPSKAVATRDALQERTFGWRRGSGSLSLLVLIIRKLLKGQEAGLSGFPAVAGWRYSFGTESPPELMFNHLPERVEKAEEGYALDENSFDFGDSVKAKTATFHNNPLALETLRKIIVYSHPSGGGVLRGRINSLARNLVVVFQNPRACFTSRMTQLRKTMVTPISMA